MLRLITSTAFLVLISAQAPAKIPCGLPPFAEKLPSEQQTALTKVWADYKEGSECETEQKKTFDIIGSLSDEDRISVFGPPPPSPHAPRVPDTFDTTPIFIKMMKSDEKKAFDDIWLSATLDDDEKHTKVEEFAKKHFKGEQLEDFNHWLGAIKKQKATIDQRISKLSSPAKKVLKKLLKIRAEEQKVLDKITPEIGAELHGLI